MSIQVVSRVWEHSRHSGGALLVLLALADFANDACEAWPSAETLARKTRMTTRNVWRELGELERSGELVRVRHGGRGRSNHYLLALGNSDKQTLKSTTGNSDKRRTKTVTSEPKEPSLERLEPVGGATSAPTPPQRGGAKGATLTAGQRGLLAEAGYTEADFQEAWQAAVNGSWAKWRRKAPTVHFVVQDIAEWFAFKARNANRDDLGVFGRRAS